MYMYLCATIYVVPIMYIYMIKYISIYVILLNVICFLN
jgi:hypothetical protein